ncbi:MAG: T9SS type A sorting domain-containing protein, partial [Bacteroidetes bacterium]|nr:T9SS type A sorting domain-containing protein [Bacteroidota bacterium]
ELAHSWFGNLITCSTSQNMWINEGFATYGAYLCKEILDPTLATYKKDIKSLHFSVLKSDGGHYALDNVPTSATYGSTSYDKGALVAYTLRNYMGDEKFFSSITQFLNENQYGNVNSEEFLQKLSVISGIDLTGFFLGWVHQPGFLNFNIDSIKPVAGSNNKYKVAFKQKLYLAQNFANSNLVDVEFVSASGEKCLIEKMKFSGEHEIVEVELPFAPVFWSIDPNGKMGDACFDYTQQIFKTGSVSLSSANFNIEVDEISDTSIIRVEHNPVAPTPAKNDHPNIVKISEKHFWRVGFLQYNNVQATYSFIYDSKYDGGLLQGYTKEDLILLYRKDASHDWQIIPATVTATSTDQKTGKVSVNSISSGEYTLGIGKDLNIKEWENNIKVYPNPTTGELRITNYKLRITNVEIFDVYGRKILSHTAHRTPNTVLDISDFSTGIYFVKITTEKGIMNKKIIKY